jgi:hypothetical protein
MQSPQPEIGPRLGLSGNFTIKKHYHFTLLMCHEQPRPAKTTYLTEKPVTYPSGKCAQGQPRKNASAIRETSRTHIARNNSGQSFAEHGSQFTSQTCA